MAKRSSKGPLYWHVWPTAWRPIGGVASSAGLKRLILPHYQPDDLAELLQWESPGVAADAAAFEQITRLSRDYFNAQPVDFSDVPCDLPGEKTFGGTVLRACREIPYGQTESYGALARRIGRPDAARAVATIMSKNPIPLVVPCHRVTYSDGRPGGFSAPGGTELKQRMLALEQRGV